MVSGSSVPPGSGCAVAVSVSAIPSTPSVAAGTNAAPPTRVRPTAPACRLIFSTLYFIMCPPDVMDHLITAAHYYFSTSASFSFIYFTRTASPACRQEDFRRHLRLMQIFTKEATPAIPACNLALPPTHLFFFNHPNADCALTYNQGYVCVNSRLCFCQKSSFHASIKIPFDCFMDAQIIICESLGFIY